MCDRRHAARALGLGSGGSGRVAGAVGLPGEGVHLGLELAGTDAEPLHLLARDGEPARERGALVRQTGELRRQRLELAFETLALAMQGLARGRGRCEFLRRLARGVVALAAVVERAR